MGKGILSLQQEMSLEYSEKSYQEVLKIRQESYWKRMKSFSLFEVIMHWTASLNKHTCRSYRGSFVFRKDWSIVLGYESARVFPFKS